MKIYAVIPAGGKGTRTGFTMPKQYLKVNGRELIVYTLELFQKNNAINGIVVSAEPEYFHLFERLKKRYRLSKLMNVVNAGRERQDSVFNALKYLPAEKNDLAVVHDAARPLLPQDVLNNAIALAVEKGNALVAIKARDTIINKSGSKLVYLEREGSFYVQTPQIFKYGDLIKAMEKAYKDGFYGTDESTIISHMGKKIHIAEGSLLNFKVTTKDDLKILKRLIPD